MPRVPQSLSLDAIWDLEDQFSALAGSPSGQPGVGAQRSVPAESHAGPRAVRGLTIEQLKEALEIKERILELEQKLEALFRPTARETQVTAKGGKRVAASAAREKETAGTQ
jgi:hypothetical protein